MKALEIIYKVLQTLEASMDNEELDWFSISNERFHASAHKMNKVWVILEEQGYVKGVSVVHLPEGGYPQAIVEYPRITEEGLRYLVDHKDEQKDDAPPLGFD